MAERGILADQNRGSLKHDTSPKQRPAPESSGASTWQPLGPAAVSSQSYGLVTGRITALALDPSDSTANKLYVGTTGGGMWYSQNAGAAAASGVEFTPLTDVAAALSGALDASISIGALTVQPGGTGVILAGTGDPNDALDSYYGTGILRSSDGGTTWSLIQETALGSAGRQYSFAGEGFAGFAWSTANPELVVAGVSQAFEGTLVNAVNPNLSYEGLYYSTDSGATWNLATITDGGGNDVQGPNDPFALPDGNAVTSVVWNPVRKLFVAAVRYHGYYQSSNGVTWTRMAAQPGLGLTTQFCPTNSASTGSTACPIFRGTLAVNPQTGDTFAWTVDVNNQDQGLWQDPCQIRSSACTTQTLTFSRQWNTAPLEENTLEGSATIANGDYNLALTAVPSQQDTILLAGANDLWKCNLAVGCTWRNTTNAFTCASAKVGPFQHAIGWSAADPLEIFVGNDSGLWRSEDAIGETGAVCASTDASHYQNLNSGLGSLAEVVSLAQVGSNPFAMMVGLGANGTAGTKASAKVSDWPEILSGEGGPVAIDSSNSAFWYANNQAGVSIHVCDQAAACTQSSFGQTPVVNDADVDDDGLTMTTPAPFLVDPADRTQLLIGTCRVWRGPVSGAGWSTGNAISSILDGNASNVSCSGDPLIRSMAALATTGGGEAAYVGMYGQLDGGATLPGHVFGAKFTPGGKSQPVWQDLTLNPVTNDTETMNQYGLDISGLLVDPHDASGSTVYATVEGLTTAAEQVRTVYRSTDGGAHWTNLTSNLPSAPVDGVAVDPQDANTVYVATDAGVYATRAISSCAQAGSSCWSAYGTDLPDAPVTQLTVTPLTASSHLLTAATYGRGIWQIPLLTSGEQLTTVTVKPATLTFGAQATGSASAVQTVTVANTGTVALNATIAISGDFAETDNCQGGAIAGGSSCAIQVRFAPTQTGTRTGQVTISANVASGQLTVGLTGTGVAAGALTLLPPSISFGQTGVDSTSSPFTVTASNSGGSAITINSVAASGPFQISANTCGASLSGGSACQVTLEFAPTQAGTASGTLTVADGAGTQKVDLSGTGEAAPTDTLSTTSLALPATVEGQQSAPVNIALTNSGDQALNSIGTSITGNFLVTSNCGTSLPGHSSCAFSVVFAPAALGVQTGVLTVSDALREQTVNLTGTGVAPPAFTITPATLAFLAQEVGTTSAALGLTVANSGGAPMANVSFQPVGQSATSFEVSSTTCGAKLTNGSSCSAQVTFKPTATGGNAANLVVSTSTIGVAAGVVPLSGTGLAPPQLGVSPPALAFNNVVIGSSSSALPVTISNTGGVGLTDLRLAVAGDYSFVPGSCTAMLAAASSCTLNITFTPTGTGSRIGVFTASSVSGAAAPATVSLQGTGTAPATIETSAGTIDFGSLAAGQTSVGKPLTVFDVGTATLKGLTLTVAGPFVLKQDQCGGSLAANQSCETQIVFAPLSAGALTGTLTIASTTQFVAPVVITLTGKGLPAPVLTVTPQQITFGSVVVGAKSTPVSVAVSDPGGAAVAGLQVGATGDFQITSDTCGVSLASGGSCTVQITFEPTAGGTRNGVLTISGTTAGLQPAQIQLTGQGQSPGSLTGSPTNIGFGNVIVGQSSAPQTATITNTGQSLAAGLAFKITGDYGIQKNTCGVSLAGGDSCTIMVVFSPSATGDRAGMLTAISTTAGVGSASIVLDGTGQPPGYITTSPASLTFPATAVGTTSGAVMVTLSDPGISGVSGLQAATTGDFSATLCASTLPASGSCNLSVTFTPSAAGTRTGQLTVTTITTGASPAVVALTGIGSLPPSIALIPASLAFPGTGTGATSAAQTITISNPGTAPLNTPTLAVTGDFQVTMNGCVTAVVAGGSCNVQIAFEPTVTGGRTGTLTVSSSTPLVQPATATLSGTGLPPASIGVSPLSLAFPVVLVGQTSTAQTVTVTNSGGAAMASLTLSVSPQFAITADGCAGALSAGASCTATIAFEPVTTGAIQGGLTVTSPQVATPAVVALSGTGGAAASLVVQPAVINFPTTGVATASAPITLTVSNPGTVTALSGLALKAPGGFVISKTTCATTLAAMASCTAQIVFAPSKPGVGQGALAVSATGVATADVTLQGTGFDFTVAVKGSSSATVSNGQTANYTLSIAPEGGVKGHFTFECGNVPANALCLFNPTQESVSGGATGTVTVEIATGQNLAVAQPTPWRDVPMVLGVLLIPLAWRRQRKALLMAALLAVMMGGVSSCLSSSGGGKPGQTNPGQPGTTPPATYSIPVTVLAEGVQHGMTLKLIVD